MNNKNINPLFGLAFWAIILVILLASCTSSAPPPTTAPATNGSGSTVSTTLDGKTLMNERCSVCHSVSRVTSKHMTADEWTATVDRMINNGAQLNAEEKQTLIDYLAANYK